ncbi:MAG: glutamine synthetase III, partial [Flammeovirgaceae bacterium]|nr:glutamine synthetase III [Flammeovirgaceae bacterium]
MAKLRFSALELVQKRQKVEVNPPSNLISDYFGENAYGLKQMRLSLSPNFYEKVKYAIRKGKKIDIDTAEAIASAVKTWALNKGVTHYTH